MKAILTKLYTFEAAHILPNVPPGHQCGRLHGHSYQVIVELRGEIDEAAGWVIDYGEMDQVVKPIVDDELDHRYLNDILANPTAENLCWWFVQRLASTHLSRLVSAITIKETAKTAARIEL